MKAKKIMVTVLAAAALVTGSVFGTMAYLTSNDSVTNTFTVGKVVMSMDEADVDEYGKVIVDDNEEPVARVHDNEYRLIPGHTYVKDPTIYIEADSEDCWVFAKVENQIAAIEADTKVAAQIEALEWKELGEGTGVYYKEHEKSDAKKEYKVFDNFTILGSVDNVTLNGDKTDADTTNDDGYVGKTIVVTGYAVQKDGLTVEQAWTAVSQG